MENNNVDFTRNFEMKFKSSPTFDADQPTQKEIEACKKLERILYINVITQAADFGAKDIDLMGGGESLVYNQFFKLIEHAKKLGLEVETFTNGTLITKDIAQDMIDYEEIPYVKLYSLNANSHDLMLIRKGA